VLTGFVCIFDGEICPLPCLRATRPRQAVVVSSREGYSLRKALPKNFWDYLILAVLLGFMLFFLTPVYVMVVTGLEEARPDRNEAESDFLDCSNNILNLDHVAESNRLGDRKLQAGEDVLKCSLSRDRRAKSFVCSRNRRVPARSESR
jgi:hypothetical protein